MKEVIASTRQTIITPSGPTNQMILATREPKLIPSGIDEKGNVFINLAGSVETTILYFSRESAAALIAHLQDFLAETEETSFN